DLPFMEATASADQIDRFGLRGGDVLLTKDSETPDDIAVPAYVYADLPGVVCGYHLALLRPIPDVDGHYLFWALTSRSSREQFSALANGITRFGIRYDSFGEVRVPLPPFERQRAIADYLDRETARIDALIKMINQQTSLLAERRQALITAAATGELQIPGVAA
ncbi:MAG: restriction endonuclease subunit S, partial [Actinobacteria bacterium]|nr:restriction endonuclease subunit S [Actinomycetota bacterium]